MPTSHSQTNLKKISLLVSLVAILATVLLYILLVTPAFATENKNTSSPVKNQVQVKKGNFFDKLTTFIKSPLAGVVLAQGNQKAVPAPKQNKPGLLQQIWNFITASPTPSPKKTIQANPTPIPTPKATAQPVSQGSTEGLTVTQPAVTSAASVIKSLSAGTTYIDLIGKTIIDSFGNVYPSSAALAQTNKPTLGTTTNKFYGLNLYQFSIDKVGGITTVLPGGIVKASSTGVLSSSSVSLDSTDVTSTLQPGNGGTGTSTYAVGDILYSAATNGLSKLGIGSSNQVLIVSSGIPAWSSTLSMTNVSVGDGSAGTPALNFSSDTDSGLWRIGANNIALTTAGSAFSGVSINSAGNVGIGLTGAASSLGVNGNAMIGYASGALGANMANSLAISGNVGIGTSSHATGYALDVNGSIWAENTLAVGSGGLTIYTSGSNVGIGTTAPNATLSIQGNVGIGYTGASQVLPSNGLAVSGNVGIGTTSPTSNLHVIGTANITGNTVVGGTLGVTGATTLSSTLAVTSTSTLTGAVTMAANSAALTFSGTTPSLTSGASLFGLFAGGNVGIGTTATMGSSFNVNGGQVIGSSFIGGAAPANGLGVSGNLGIGTSTANSALTVSGGATIGSDATYKIAAPSNGLLVQGNVGIGTTSPTQLFSVGTGATSNFTVASTGNVGVGSSLTVTSVGVFSAGINVTGLSDLTGNVGVGGSLTVASVGIFSKGVEVTGAVRATAGFNGLCTNTTPAAGANPITCNQDVAEIYASSEDVAPGDVLSFDTATARSVAKSGGAYDQNLIGIVSTSPGLLLGINGSDVILGGESSSYGKNMNPKAPAVALTGKVPVKVSTENGSIKVGDYLTSSSIRGVAMKATKAGVVIGSALESYDGDAIGSILVFVKLGYFNGVKIADLVDQTVAVTGVSPNFSQLILAKLLADRQAILPAGNASELLTDRIAAGIEVITPQLTADNVVAGLIRPAEGKNLIITLTANQAFNITNEANESVISFDNQGNATFKGTIVAAAVKADQIEGLRVLTDALITNKISALLDQKISQATASSAVAGVSSSSPALDANILVRLNADGGLTVGGPAEFKAQSIFTALSEFVSSVIFRGDVNFLGRIFLPKDSVGMAVIEAGSDAVTVSFERAYGATPSVNVTQTNYAGNDGAGNSILTGDIRFVVQGLSGSGFIIKLNKAAPAKMVFSWAALAQNNQFTSTQPASAPVESPASSVTPAPSSTPIPSATPAPTETPTPTVTSTPEPSLEPTPAPTVAPTPAPSVIPAGG